jgi:hypothetical protein
MYGGREALEQGKLDQGPLGDPEDALAEREDERVEPRDGPEEYRDLRQDVGCGPEDLGEAAGSRGPGATTTHTRG